MGKYFQVAYETRGYYKNICVWFDGTIRPMLGHSGKCKWVYDGQVFVHKASDPKTVIDKEKTS